MEIKKEESRVDLDDKKLGEIVNQKKKDIIIPLIIALILIIILIIVLIVVFTKKGKSGNNFIDNFEDTTEENSEVKYEESNELDTFSNEELNKARESFKQFNFTNEDKSKFILYNLFIPENYQNEKYPLMVFIGDASLVGKETTAPLNETIGGPIWATEIEQKKHKSFVLVPEYSEVIIDDRDGYTITEYIELTTKLITEIINIYNIDQNRIYGTGQSMGAMTTMYLLANRDIYAAGLIVDGQWKLDELEGLKNAVFTYFAAGGDEKAFNGQNEVKEFLSSQNIKYGQMINIDAQEKVEILNKNSTGMYNLGYKKNFITYINGTVLRNSRSKSEHMASFKYGYRIDVVRDWIFDQKKN